MVVSGLVRELSRSTSLATGNMRTCLTVDGTAGTVTVH